jgi:branched-chain amino acid transport system ATP-binding protein
MRSGNFRDEEKRIKDKALELLEAFNLTRYAYVPAKALPYGEQRRLEIARALSSNPKLLLLDEPAAGMNPREIDELLERIDWLKDEFNLTIFLIEHQMRMAPTVPGSYGKSGPSYLRNHSRFYGPTLAK